MKRYLISVLLFILHINGWAASVLPSDVSLSAIPPSAQLSYSFNLKQGLISASGNSDIVWKTSHGQYDVTTLSHVFLLGTVLNVKSTGDITEKGLAVNHFNEKSFFKKPLTLSFNKENHTYTQQQNNKTFPVSSALFDRANVIWQIVLLLNTDTTWVQPDNELTLNMAEPNGVTPWQFKVIGTEKLSTPLGVFNTLHIKRLENHRQQTIDIWFAADHHWYPVQLYFNEKDGSYFRQTISKIIQD